MYQLHTLQVDGQLEMLRCCVSNRSILSNRGVSLKCYSHSIVGTISTFAYTICALYLHPQVRVLASHSKLRHAERRMMQAYVEYLLATRAHAFYGNILSSFSDDIVDTFKSR